MRTLLALLPVAALAILTATVLACGGPQIAPETAGDRRGLEALPDSGADALAIATISDSAIADVAIADASGADASSADNTPAATSPEDPEVKEALLVAVKRYEVLRAPCLEAVRARKEAAARAHGGGFGMTISTGMHKLANHTVVELRASVPKGQKTAGLVACLRAALVGADFATAQGFEPTLVVTEH